MILKRRVLAEHAGNAGLFLDLEDSITFVKMYFKLGKAENGRFLEDKPFVAFTRSYANEKRQSFLRMGFKKD